MLPLLFLLVILPSLLQLLPLLLLLLRLLLKVARFLDEQSRISHPEGKKKKKKKEEEKGKRKEKDKKKKKKKRRDGGKKKKKQPREGGKKKNKKKKEVETDGEREMERVTRGRDGEGEIQYLSRYFAHGAVPGTRPTRGREGGKPGDEHREREGYYITNSTENGLQIWTIASTTDRLVGSWLWNEASRP
jgi:hypothetical protein